MGDGYLFRINTAHSSNIKILVEALKEILCDTSIHITSEDIRIITMDNTKMILIHVKLYADRFEHYECVAPINIGINMLNFYKIIKMIDARDILTLFIHEDQPDKLGIIMENTGRGIRTVYYLNLLELTPNNYTIPQIETQTHISFLSTDFQKYIRNMYAITDGGALDIKIIGNSVVLSCSGDYCNVEATMVNDDGLENEMRIYNQNDDEIIQGEYSLKNLNKFIKCTPLSNTVILYMNNDFPLIVKYDIASLGEIKLILGSNTKAD
jgi:proliferating cell nuclear antigen